jgi:hypothetical protein
MLVSWIMTYQHTGGEFDIMRLTIVALGACAILASAPVSAQSSGSQPPGGQSPGGQHPDNQREPSGTQLTLEGLEKLLLGLQRMVEDLPRYNLPEINENGDIILRRIDPNKKPEQPMTLIPQGNGVDL